MDNDDIVDDDDDDGDEDDDEIHDYQTLDNHRETVEEKLMNTIYWPMLMGEVIAHFFQMSVFRYRNTMTLICRIHWKGLKKKCLKQKIHLKISVIRKERPSCSSSR